MSEGDEISRRSDEWSARLKGKTIVDTDAQVTSSDHVSKEALPQPNRVMGPGHFATMDWRPERLNVTTDESGKVKTAYFG